MPDDPDAECALDFHESAANADDGDDEDGTSPLVSSALIIAVLGATEVLLLVVVAILVGYIYMIRKDRFAFVNRGPSLPSGDAPIEVELDEIKAPRAEPLGDDM